MKVFSRLPPTRYNAGELWVLDHEGRRLFGPVRARGEADNRGAAIQGNPAEDPAQLYGDHPAGLYRVIAIEQKDHETYGPYFLLLDPLEGEALEAKLHGRAGLGIHGGRLHGDGRLRETYGCLRLDNDAVETLFGFPPVRAIVMALVHVRVEGRE